MMLKQRFDEGRTNYTDIGKDFMYTEFFGDGFDDITKQMGLNEDSKKDCKGVIHDGRGLQIPIYNVFPQWIYTNDGQLFMTLV